MCVKYCVFEIDHYHHTNKSPPKQVEAKKKEKKKKRKEDISVNSMLKMEYTAA